MLLIDNDHVGVTGRAVNTPDGLVLDFLFVGALDGAQIERLDESRQGSVRRAVVDDDDFKAGVMQCQQRADVLDHRCLLVVGRHQQRDWHRDIAVEPPQLLVLWNRWLAVQGMVSEAELEGIDEVLHQARRDDDDREHECSGLQIRIDEVQDVGHAAIAFSASTICATRDARDAFRLMVVSALMPGSPNS